MKDIKYFQNKIKEKRKLTDFRDFLKEIVSWHPFILSKNWWYISRFPKTLRVKITSNKDFNENRDELTTHSVDYDFDKWFFENFEILFKNTPLPNVFHYQENQNSDYTDIAVDSKNAYLSNSVVLYSQNVLYSFMVRWHCDNVLNSLYVTSNSENIYFSRWIISSFNVFYSSFINNWANIWFSSNLIWCSECLFCSDMENQKYCIKNEQYSEEEYFIKKQEILKNKDEFYDFYTKIETTWYNYWSQNVTWNYIVDSKDVENWSYVFNTVNWKNIMFIWAKSVNENFYDVFIAWGSGRYDNYAVQSTGWADNVYCSSGIWYSMNIYYSYFLENCSYCLWCVWLRNKSYCIFNKEYTKDDWEKLAIKIFEQMEKQPHPNPLLKGEGEKELWSFFPWSLNPFYFNDTAAYLIDDSFSKEEVEKEWYMWRDEEIKVDIPDDSQVIYTNFGLLPPRLRGIEGESNGEIVSDFQWYDENWKWFINPEILKKVIKDKKWNYYRIVKQEYDFLIKHELPIPEIHWLDRIKLNFWK